MNEDNTTRELIINTARRLAMADGLFEVTVEEVTKHAEISEEVFYKYFSNIHELIMELINTRLGLSDEDVMKLPLEEKIKTFTSELMKQIELASVDFCRQWMSENLRNSYFISIDKEILRKLLKASIDSGELRKNTPEEEFADFIVSTIYGMMLNWCMTDKKFEPLEHIDKFSDFIIDSLKPYMKK